MMKHYIDICDVYQDKKNILSEEGINDILTQLLKNKEITELKDLNREVKKRNAKARKGQEEQEAAIDHGGEDGGAGELVYLAQVIFVLT